MRYTVAHNQPIMDFISHLPPQFYFIVGFFALIALMLIGSDQYERRIPCHKPLKDRYSPENFEVQIIRNKVFQSGNIGVKSFQVTYKPTGNPAYANVYRSPEIDSQAWRAKVIKQAIKIMKEIDTPQSELAQFEEKSIKPDYQFEIVGGKGFFNRLKAYI